MDKSRAHREKKLIAPGSISMLLDRIDKLERIEQAVLDLCDNPEYVVVDGQQYAMLLVSDIRAVYTEG